MKKLLFLGLIALSTFAPLSAQCVPDTMVPDRPGIYPDSFPPFQGCVFGELDVTFVFPRDTLVTIAGQSNRLPFNSFTITSVSGLPNGLSWRCNLAPDCEYDTRRSNPNADTVGCVRFSGTPTTPGRYPFVVNLDIEVPLLGTQQATYNGVIDVAPCIISGNCYSYQLTNVCSPATLALTNLIPSGGEPGFSYEWSLESPRQPTFSSTDETPQALFLTDTGTYVLSYQAIVDTTGFILDSVIIQQVNCGDIFNGRPDLYWKLFDPSGNEVVNTLNNPGPVQNADLPLNANVSIPELATGQYEFQVWDDDLTSNDDGCANGGDSASVFFSIPTSPGGVTVIQNGLTVTFYIRNPQSIIQCSDTFELLEPPTPPTVDLLGDSILCNQDTIFLVATFDMDDSLQWLRDDIPLPGENIPLLEVTEAGVYSAVVVDQATGCSVPSARRIFIDTVTVEPPQIVRDDTLSSAMVVDPKANLQYIWYKDSVAVDTTTNFTYLGNGAYWARAYDPVTDCQSGPTETFTITGISPETLVRIDVFPNPFEDELRVSWRSSIPQAGRIQLYDLMGRTLFERSFPAGTSELSIPALAINPGVYVLTLTTQSQRLVRRVIRR